MFSHKDGIYCITLPPLTHVIICLSASTTPKVHAQAAKYQSHLVLNFYLKVLFCTGLKLFFFHKLQLQIKLDGFHAHQDMLH